MKGFRILMIVALAALLAAGLSGTTYAFHDGGVAECAGCHTMHNSVGGATVRTGAGTPVYLLIATKPSDVCLTCHAAYGQYTDNGAGFGSAGDFFWVTRTYGWTAHGHAEESPGDRHGHNVISDTAGIAVDDALATAPGGSYNSQYLGCNSCHDPHGKQGNELLLYGSELTAANYPGGFSFSAGAPVLASAGRRTASSNAVSNSRHTAFGSGMSSWCGNCHSGFLTGHRHPVGTLSSGRISSYNAYIYTDNLTGTPDTAYREKVPFETGSDNAATLSTTSTSGPVAGDGGTPKVMCLTCHRAHASAYMYAGRWDFETGLLVESHPMAGDTGADTWDVANKDYGEAFPAEQRSLCNKCHLQD